MTTAVSQWDIGTAIAVRYGRCRPRAGCIRVYERDEGENGDAGRTDFRHAGQTMLSAVVHLNDAYASDGPLASQTTVCHEIGHGLGLPHSRSTDSCMYPMVGDGGTAPSTDDRAALNAAWRAVQKNRH